MPSDILIQGGTIVDGTGKPRYRGNVAIKDGKIAELGNVAPSALKTIDAEGLVVSPGFIDTHTHYDAQLLWDPLATPACWHGFTTLLIGNCGFTIAPCKPSDRDYSIRFMAFVEGMPADVLRTSIDWSWGTFGEYLDALRKGLGVNVAAMIGHSALRYYVMGEDSYERPATQDELEKMQGMVRQAMEDGAMGFSSTQQPFDNFHGRRVPSLVGGWTELVQLASMLRDYNSGVIHCGPSPSGAGLVGPEFREVLLDLCRVSGRPVIWSSLKHAWSQPTLYKEVMDFMAAANEKGYRIYAAARAARMDSEWNFRFAGTMFQFGNRDSSATWREILGKPHEEKKRLLADAEVRQTLRAEWDQSMATGGPELRIEVRSAALDRNKPLVGSNLQERARHKNQHLVDTMLNIAVEEDLGTQFARVGTMNADDNAVAEIVIGPYSLPGVSDGGAHMDMECSVDFSNILLAKWVREKQVLTLEQAIHALTSRCAQFLGLPDRGVIQEGMAADLVLFDPETIGPGVAEVVADLPGGGQRLLKRPPDAVRAVIVNGQVLLEDGTHTGVLPGQVLGGY